MASAYVAIPVTLGRYIERDVCWFTCPTEVNFDISGLALALREVRECLLVQAAMICKSTLSVNECKRFLGD